jgi:hypothetical protein
MILGWEKSRGAWHAPVRQPVKKSTRWHRNQPRLWQSRSPDEVVLFWTDETGQYKFIGIKYLGMAQFSVNGQLLPATRADLQAGILKVLRESK